MLWAGYSSELLRNQFKSGLNSVSDLRDQLWISCICHRLGELLMFFLIIPRLHYIPLSLHISLPSVPSFLVTFPYFVLCGISTNGVVRPVVLHVILLVEVLTTSSEPS